MARRGRRWLWAGRLVCLLLVGGLVTYLMSVGLDKADKVASGIGAVAALLALIAPYLIPSSQDDEATDAHASGAGAVAIGGTNTGEVIAEATGTIPSAAPAPDGGVSATGPASVAVGGKNTALIRTRFTGRGQAG
ncbi:hypothetical protein Pen02_81060 [Plantactinospora endophytica]|uniref:Phage holin family protein n=1 Tax=Plantactinospora endophytica TaxID=673535 RepID=A0ABQ4EEU0_9ACTN|nr:hypothetical protein Pen02_81060 [Plantactinospora endophytica]